MTDIPNRNEIEILLRSTRAQLVRARRNGAVESADLAQLGIEILEMLAEEEAAYDGGSSVMAGLIADELGEEGADD